MTWQVSADRLAPESVDACLRLAAHLARGDTVSAVKIAAGAAGSPPDFWDAARAHQLVEFVAGMLAPYWWKIRCPEELRQRIHQWLETRRTLRERLDTTFDALDDALRKADVEFIVLKGTPFAGRYYPREELRSSRDLDVLVRRGDIPRCLAALRPIGFEPLDRRRNPFSTHRIRTDHAASLGRDGVEVDVHWRLRNAAVYRIDDSRLWRHASSHAWDHRRCRVLSPEYELVLLLVSVAHDIQRGACRLKHLLDTYLVLRQIHDRTDWEQFLVDREAEVTLGECANVLDLVRKLLAGPEEFPALANALAAHGARVVCLDRAAALALVTAPRGHIANQQWFARISPVWHWRSIVRVLDRNVLRPGRIPWLAIKAVRRLRALAHQRAQVR